MNTSFQHTKLGALHEARYTAAKWTCLGMGVWAIRKRWAWPCTEDER